MDEDTRYEPVGPSRSSDAAAWAIVVLVLLDVGLLGYIAWNSWNVARESEATFAGMGLGNAVAGATESGLPVRYEDADWNVSFDLPAGTVASAERLSAAGDVELRIDRKPIQGAASPNALVDTGVRVRIGPAAGFSRYYARPYTEYAGFHRLMAVGRPAAAWIDPAGASDAEQVIVIDDSRYGREVSVIYKGVVADAQSLATGILDSMRLTVRTQEAVVKSGWKIFTQEPIRFQYPEDYRVTTPTPGRIEVDGKGGRLEIRTAYDVGQNARPGALPGSGTGAPGMPDEFFDLQYAVDMRVEFYYAADAKDYDRSVLKEIGSTVGLDR